MKARQKLVVCPGFHRAGIVVPVDENDVGYREVPETPGTVLLKGARAQKIGLKSTYYPPPMK